MELSSVATKVGAWHKTGGVPDPSLKPPLSNLLTLCNRTATNNMRYSTGTRIAIESDTVLTSVQPYGRADTHVPTPANHQT